MARGVKTGDANWVGCVKSLERLVGTGALTIPLSGAHYLELWHRSSRDSREYVGSLMRDLSGYAAWPPVQRVQALEIDSFVERKRGVDLRVVASDLIGRGACHAFDSPYGRLRFVESIANESQSEGAATQPFADFDELVGAIGPERWEWFQLVGNEEIMKPDGLDRTPQHRLGSQYQQEELALRQHLKADPGMMDRVEDVVIAQEVGLLVDCINETCLAKQVNPLGLFLDENDHTVASDAVRGFVRGVPTLDVITALRTWKHRDLSHPWDQHDLTDLIALAVAVPYADEVVTEKRWMHLANAAGLARRYRTGIGAGLLGLQRALVALAQFPS